MPYTSMSMNPDDFNLYIIRIETYFVID